MSRDDTTYAEIQRMDTEFEALTGRKAFGWVSEPTPTSIKILFGDARVCLGMPEAFGYMRHLLSLAQDQPDKLPYPFDQPLTAEQDPRTHAD